MLVALSKGASRNITFSRSLSLRNWNPNRLTSTNSSTLLRKRSYAPALGSIILFRIFRGESVFCSSFIPKAPALSYATAAKSAGKSTKGAGVGKSVVTLQDVSKRLPDGKTLFEDVSLGILEGAKIGILGINGAGKSSFMKVIAGIDTEFDGEVTRVPNLKIGYLEQEPHLDPEKTVRGNVFEGVSEKIAALDRYQELKAKKEKTKEESAELHELEDRIASERLDDLRRRIDVAMQALRCPPGDAAVTNLSGGERRRVALCRLLVSQPDVLLLDEPTNHLDASSVAWLERYLGEYRGAVIAVTHDRYFLDNVAGWILEIDRGKMYPFKGNYTAWVEAKEKRLELEKRKENALARALRQELEWIRASPRARQAKSKARVSAYEQRVKEKDSYRAPESGTIIIPQGPRLGRVVIEADKVNLSMNGRALLRDVSFRIPPGAVVGIIGPNGAGKTTLFNIITGQLRPDSGKIRIGDTVQLGYVSQSRDTLDPTKTVYEEISDGQETIEFDGRQYSMRAYVASFNFRESRQEASVSSLSGGERNRVHLAKMIRNAPNVLMLDEPTNDLDVEVLRSLENALQDFAGTAIIISHDRWFLDRLCTHIIAFEGDGKVHFFEGNYADYDADRMKRLGTRYGQEKGKFAKIKI